MQETMELSRVGRSLGKDEKGKDPEYWHKDFLLVNGGTIPPWLKEREVLGLIKEDMGNSCLMISVFPSEEKAQIIRSWYRRGEKRRHKIAVFRW